MISKFIQWFFSPSEVPIADVDVYSKLIELQERIEALEIENVETTNCIYELMENIRALDARIDILAIEKNTDK